MNQITIRRGNRVTHEWPDVPSASQVFQEMHARLAADGSLFSAMNLLESSHDAYPSADECLDNVALTFLARGKPIEQMTDADFALIGAHIAQWFHKNALLPTVQAEQDAVAQRLDDEATA